MTGLRGPLDQPDPLDPLGKMGTMGTMVLLGLLDPQDQQVRLDRQDQQGLLDPLVEAAEAAACKVRAPTIPLAAGWVITITRRFGQVIMIVSLLVGWSCWSRVRHLSWTTMPTTGLWVLVRSSHKKRCT